MVSVVANSTEAVVQSIATRSAETSINLRQFADVLPNLVWITDPSGQATFFNKRWLEYTGQAIDDALRDWASVLHPDDLPHTMAAWSKSIGSGAAYEVEYRMRGADGAYRWFVARGSLQHDVETGGNAWVGTCTDIHRLKVSEAKLADQQAFMDRLLSSIEDCIKVMDLDARLIFMSEGGLRVMEVDDFETIRLNYWPDNWTDSVTRTQAALACQSAREGGIGRFQGFCSTQKGTPKWWDVQVTGIRGADGTVERLLAISRDVTSVRAYEENLRKTKERLELALDSGDIAVSTWDMEQGIVIGDHRLASMFGLDVDLVKRGAPMGDFLSVIHPSDLAEAERIISQTLQTGEGFEFEFRIVLGDVVRWFVSRGKTKHDESGKPILMPTTTIDITALREATEAKELLARELAHRIKNLFALVNGLVSLSLRTANNQSTSEFANALLARINALSRAFELVRPNELGVEHTDATLIGIAREVALPYGARVSVIGDDVTVGPRAVTSIALILHELSTNSLKHGSLSSSDGVVELSGRIDQDSYILTWKESRGPVITHEPTRKGFGSLLTHRTVQGTLGGRMETNWRPEGLSLRMSLPIDRLKN